MVKVQHFTLFHSIAVNGDGMAFFFFFFTVCSESAFQNAVYSDGVFQSTAFTETVASVLGGAYRSRGGHRGARVVFGAAVSAVAVNVCFTGGVLAGRLHYLGRRTLPPHPTLPLQRAGPLRQSRHGNLRREI